MINKLKKYRKRIADATIFSARNNELLLKLDSEISSLKHDTQERLDHLNLQFAPLFERLDHLEMQIKLQNEIAAVNTSAFENYKNAHSNMDIVLLATGPTLNRYNPLANSIHIGVNDAFKYEKVKLDYYFLCDAKDALKYEKPKVEVEDIINLDCKKFLGTRAIIPNHFYEPSESFFAPSNASRFYFAENKEINIFQDIRFHPTAAFSSVAFPALHFALFTNPKRIYLVGCDVSSDGYFTNEVQSVSLETMRTSLKQIMLGYRKFKEFAVRWYPKTEIISINPVNLKGMFKDVYTDENGTLIYRETQNDSTEKQQFSDSDIEYIIDSHIDVLIRQQKET
jgi:hypothetical protein